jgi:hypothetical protein
MAGLAVRGPGRAGRRRHGGRDAPRCSGARAGTRRRRRGRARFGRAPPV